MKLIASMVFNLLALTTSLNAIATNPISIDSLNLGMIETSQQNILKHFNGYSENSKNLDQNGWSILAPSMDSRLVYVSSSGGDDQLGEIYNPSKVNNINLPVNIAEFKTIEAAQKHIRKGYPDYLFLKRGDSWLLEKPIKLKGGRSSSERMVLMAYGESHARPIIKTASNAIRVFGTRSFIAITGLHLYAHNRDPSSANFSGWGSVPDSMGIGVYKKPGTLAQSILIENCIINYYKTGIAISGGAKYEDIVIRRNIVTNSYSEKSHSQGLYASNASLLLEGNLFDHNGWFKQKEVSFRGKKFGQATKFNHNAYFTDANNSIIRNNVFLRASSIHNKFASNSKEDIDSINSSNLIVRDNFYYGGEIGISAVGNADRDTGPRWINISIVNNVLIGMGKNQPTNRTLGWYIKIDDWDKGVVCGNYLLKNQNKMVTNLQGVSVTGHSSNIVISHNTISGLITERPTSVAINLSRGPVNNVTVAFNSIQLQDSQMRVLGIDQNKNNKFGSNDYFTEANKEYWFKLGKENLSFSDWEKITMDINSHEISTASNSPERDFDSYMSLIGTSSVDKFIENAIDKSEHNSPEDYIAETINEYFRHGYGNQSCPSLM